MRALAVLAALGLLLGSFAVASPVAAGDPCYHGFDLPPLTEGIDPQVKLMPCAFAPTVVRVAPGTTVEFFSGPYDVHLITGAGQEWGSRDDEIQPDSMVSFRFLRAGPIPTRAPCTAGCPERSSSATGSRSLPRPEPVRPS